MWISGVNYMQRNKGDKKGERELGSEGSQKRSLTRANGKTIKEKRDVTEVNILNRNLVADVKVSQKQGNQNG